MTEYRFCTVADEGHLRIVTINRPEVMNSLHREANAELAGVWDAFAADPELWVGIVTGAGERAFSAGNDLKHQAGGGKMGCPPSGFAGLTSRFDLDQAADRRGQRRRHGRRLRDRARLRHHRRLRDRRVRPARAAGRPGGAGRRPAPAAARHRHQAGDGHDPDRPAGLRREGKELGFVNEVVPAQELAGARRWAEQIRELADVDPRLEAGRSTRAWPNPACNRR